MLIRNYACSFDTPASKAVTSLEILPRITKVISKVENFSRITFSAPILHNNWPLSLLDLGPKEKVEFQLLPNSSKRPEKTFEYHKMWKYAKLHNRTPSVFATPIGKNWMNWNPWRLVENLVEGVEYPAGKELSKIAEVLFNSFSAFNIPALISVTIALYIVSRRTNNWQIKLQQIRTSRYFCYESVIWLI